MYWKIKFGHKAGLEAFKKSDSEEIVMINAREQETFSNNTKEPKNA